MKNIILFILIFSYKSFSEKNLLNEKMEQAFRSKGQARFIQAVSSVLAEDEKNLKALNYLGLYHLKKGRIGLARIAFEKGLSHHPKSFVLHNNMGLVALRENQKHSAVLSFEQSLKYNSSYLSALINLSSLYVEFYNYEKALPLLRKAYSIMKEDRKLRLSPKYIKTANNYAVVLTWAKDFKQAEFIYRHLYKKDYLAIEPLINYAILLIDYLKNLNKAIKILDRADFVVKKSKNKREIRNLRNKIRKAKNEKK